MNLKQETLKVLADHDKTIDDVAYITNVEHTHAISISSFLETADKEYDDGYGGHEVNLDLLIVLKNGDQMRRGEYDGSEWWDYHPTQPTSIPEDLPLLDIWED